MDAQKKYRPELLAPAGNLEKLQMAFHYGADGVYLGGKNFNLRVRADNFSFSDLKKAKKIADQMHKKIYCTVNISFKNRDFKKLGTFCDKLLQINLNNLIVSDLGVIQFLYEHYKNQFNISVSTQANVTNYHYIKLLEQYNVKRIILARELNLKEIREIKENIKTQIETFIHGAMCVSYSGRCLLSEYLTSRSANQGDCTQSCRWDYYLIEKTREKEHFTISEDNDSTTILSSKDLCTLSILDKLLKARIDSFKIEGRMKSLYYVANVTRVYRYAIDRLLPGKKIDKDFLLHELDLVSHRPYFTGFFEKNPSSITYDKAYVRNVVFIGYLKKRVKDNLYEVELKNKLEKKEKIEIILPDMKNVPVKQFTLYDQNRNKTDRGIINRKFYIELNEEVAPWGIIRKRV